MAFRAPAPAIAVRCPCLDKHRYDMLAQTCCPEPETVTRFRDAQLANTCQVPEAEGVKLQRQFIETGMPA